MLLAVCHAEMNAIITANRRQADLSKCYIFCTLGACDDCASAILQSTIIKVVYAKENKKENGIKGKKLLKQELKPEQLK